MVKVMEASEAIDLIKKMLSEEAIRPTAQEVLSHPWFKKAESQSLDLSIDIEKFKNYVHFNNLKKIVLTYIATRVKDSEVSHLREIFEMFDKKNDGSITIEELK